MQVLLAQTTSYYAGNAFGYGLWALGFVALGLGIWAAVDASKYEDWIWDQAGQNKVLWMVLVTVIPLIACACCGILGFIPVGIYFLVIKKKLDEVRNRGGGYGGYDPYGGGPNPYGPYGAPGGYPPPTPPAPGGPAYPPPAPGGPAYPPPASGGPAYPPPDPNAGGYPPPAPGGPAYPPPDPNTGGYPPQQ